MDILTVSILIRKILTKGFMQIYPYNSIFCNLGILVSLLSLSGYSQKKHVKIGTVKKFILQLFCYL